MYVSICTHTEAQRVLQQHPFIAYQECNYTRRRSGLALDAW
jgi:hypothetical protein